MRRDLTEEEERDLRELRALLPQIRKITREDRVDKAVSALDRMGPPDRVVSVVDFAGLVADYAAELGGLGKLLRAFSVIWGFLLKTWPAWALGLAAFFLFEDQVRTLVFARFGVME